nr:TonB-dependent receptor [Pseudomonas gessardii]
MANTRRNRWKTEKSCCGEAGASWNSTASWPKTGKRLRATPMQSVQMPMTNASRPAYVQPGQIAITNLLLRYDVTPQLSTSVNLNNLFDCDYFSYAGNCGMYGAPGNLMTSVKYDF